MIRGCATPGRRVAVRRDDVVREVTCGLALFGRMARYRVVLVEACWRYLETEGGE